MKAHYALSVKSVASHSPRMQRRQLRNRDAILDAAEQLFADHGFQGLRIDSIAETADVSVGTVYVHFGSKEGVIAAAADRILDRAEHYMAQAYVLSDSPIEQVAASGAAYHNLLEDHPFLVRFLVAELPALPDDPALDTIRARITSLHEQLAATIDVAIAQGQITGLDSRMLATFLLGAWNGVHALGARLAVAGSGPAEIRDCLNQARRILLTGMAAEGAGEWQLLSVARPDQSTLDRHSRAD